MAIAWSTHLPPLFLCTENGRLIPALQLLDAVPGLCVFVDLAISRYGLSFISGLVLAYP